MYFLRLRPLVDKPLTIYKEIRDAYLSRELSLFECFFFFDNFFFYTQKKTIIKLRKDNTKTLKCLTLLPTKKKPNLVCTYFVKKFKLVIDKILHDGHAQSKSRSPNVLYLL